MPDENGCLTYEEWQETEWFKKDWAGVTLTARTEDRKREHYHIWKGSADNPKNWHIFTDDEMVEQIRKIEEERGTPPAQRK